MTKFVVLSRSRPQCLSTLSHSQESFSTQILGRSEMACYKTFADFICHIMNMPERVPSSWSSVYPVKVCPSCKRHENKLQKKYLWEPIFGTWSYSGRDVRSQVVEARCHVGLRSYVEVATRILRLLCSIHGQSVRR